MSACVSASQFPLTSVQQLAEVSSDPVVNGIPEWDDQTQIVTDPHIVSQVPLFGIWLLTLLYK